MKYTKLLRIVVSLIIFQVAISVYADNTETRYRLAGHPSTSAAMFRDLAIDKNPSIRKRVAGNRKTPKEILLDLTKDSDQSVKIALATNLSAPDEVFTLLATDSILAVRSVVARFEYVPVAALTILSKDKDADIRLEVVKNLNTTKEILFDLIGDPNDSVRATAQQALQRLNDDN